MKKYLLAISLWLTTMAVAAQEGTQNEMLLNGIKFLDVPYVAHTLETDGPEELVINLDEVDCTTFVEYVLAESLSPRLPDGDISEASFTELVQKIRYRGGLIKGYTSRLHYMAEWINNGLQQGLIEDVTAVHSADMRQVDFSYMTRHIDQYPQLAASPQNVATMRKVEEVLSKEAFHWLPEEKLPAEGLSWIKDGDIIALVTNMQGLDISHMGIAMYVDGKLTLLHASSSSKKVEISKRALSQMLKDSQQWIGLRVLRMKKS